MSQSENIPFQEKIELYQIERNELIRRKTFKNVRNYIVQQQAIFIALLNQWATITISHPIKKSILTQQRIKIESIGFPNGLLEVNDFVKTRSKRRYEIDVENGIPRKTAIRRLTQYKIMENQHLLTDILFDYGFRFETYFTLGKNGTPKTEIVEKIFFNKRELYNKMEIIETGNKINEYLYSQLLFAKSIVFKQNDPILQSFLTFY